MPHTVSVRDVVRRGRAELPPDELALRVPYDLFTPTGPVRMLGAVAAWTEGGVEKTGRVATARLGETNPGACSCICPAIRTTSGGCARSRPSTERRRSREPCG